MTMLQPLKVWFEQQSERDQLMLKVAAVVLAFAVVYWGIWQPVTQAVAAQSQRLTQQENLYTWVQQQGRKAQSLQSTNAQRPQLNGSLVQVINATAAQSGLRLSRIQPRGEEVQVFIDEIEFNRLMGWLALLETRGALILQIDVAEASAPGLVKVRRLELGQ